MLNVTLTDTPNAFDCKSSSVFFSEKKKRREFIVLNSIVVQVHIKCSSFCSNFPRKNLFGKISCTNFFLSGNGLESHSMKFFLGYALYVHSFRANLPGMIFFCTLPPRPDISNSKVKGRGGEGGGRNVRGA